WASNTLTIAATGSVLAKSAYLGWAANNPGNQLTITGASLYVTNGLGNGVLDVRNGTLALNNAVVIADPLLATNGNPSAVQFNSGADGANPYAGLVQASDGNFYGTTYNGGSHGAGSIFRISSAGVFTNLYSFGSIAGDGANPYAGLVQASNGLLYGTTVNGGALGGSFGSTPLGTIFAVNSVGGYGFVDFFGTNGAQPYGGLIQASDGNLYGTTSAGGTNYIPAFG